MYQPRQEPKGNIFKGMKGDWRNFSAHSKQEKIFFLYFFDFQLSQLATVQDVLLAQTATRR